MTTGVAKQSDAVARMAVDWTLIEALMGGTRAMRAASRSLLPQWPAEDDDSYKARLTTATLFPAYSRTVEVLSGKPFSKPLTVGEDVPSSIKGWSDDIDLQGRNLHVFASNLCTEVLAYGFAGILIDYPKNQTLRTRADEAQAGVRPYFVLVPHGAILGWQTERINGALVLTQLRLLEATQEADGPFAQKTVEQVRVLERGRWEIWRKDAKDTWVLVEEGTTTLREIPFVPAYGRRRDFMVGSPPMLELAHQNVEHWQSKSDQQTILHVARVPIFFTKGMDEESKLKVGAGARINATDPQADAKYVEHSGKAIEAGRLSLLDLEDRMRQTGAELLVIKPGNTTRVQTLVDDEQGKCDLQRIVQSIEDAVDQALQFMAEWVKEPTGGHVEIYDDFGARSLAEASAQMLLEARADGSITTTTLLNEFKRRGILSEDVDVAAEVIAAKAEYDQRPQERKENDNI